ncbi:MAG: hypothetical protein ACYTDX_05000, partial [Planctomycetota bacterium]
RHVRLFTVNVVIVLEPPIGILIGSWLFPVEVTMAQVGGGVLLSAAVVVALLPEWRKMKEPDSRLPEPQGERADEGKGS